MHVARFQGPGRQNAFVSAILFIDIFSNNRDDREAGNGSALPPVGNDGVCSGCFGLDWKIVDKFHDLAPIVAQPSDAALDKSGSLLGVRIFQKSDLIETRQADRYPPEKVDELRIAEVRFANEAGQTLEISGSREGITYRHCVCVKNPSADRAGCDLDPPAFDAIHGSFRARSVKNGNFGPCASETQSRGRARRAFADLKSSGYIHINPRRWGARDMSAENQSK